MGRVLTKPNQPKPPSEGMLARRAKFPQSPPSSPTPNLGSRRYIRGGFSMGLLFVCSHFRHQNMFPALGIVHYAQSMGDCVSFVLRVPRLEGVMFGRKALGEMTRTCIWMHSPSLSHSLSHSHTHTHNGIKRCQINPQSSAEGMN